MPENRNQLSSHSDESGQKTNYGCAPVSIQDSSPDYDLDSWADHMAGARTQSATRDIDS